MCHSCSVRVVFVRVINSSKSMVFYLNICFCGPQTKSYLTTWGHNLSWVDIDVEMEGGVVIVCEEEMGLVDG